MSKIQPFHLAIPVFNLEKCRQFYGEVIGCEEGRSSDKWVDFNFFGHQVVIHEVEGRKSKVESESNPVDGKEVPVPHFGVILDMGDWKNLAGRLKVEGIEFVIEPYIRFEGEVGEQATMFFLDPDGNALEFKAFKHLGQLFAK